MCENLRDDATDGESGLSGEREHALARILDVLYSYALSSIARTEMFDASDTSVASVRIC